MEITYQQKEYAQHLRPISLSKERQRCKEAPATEREIAALRAINGAANWLSGQSRPDLSVQTSFSQQCFPVPKVKDLVYANQVVHRAKQYSHVEITVRKIAWERLCICFHSDAGFGNAKAHSTQAGYIAAFADAKLADNEPSSWSPFAWKSYKLPRKVASTLAGEAQAYATAAAVSEWMSLMLSEAMHGCFDLRHSQQWQDAAAPAVLVNGLKLRDQIAHVPIIGITDCKSLYDNLTSMSSVSKVEDKRIAIDLAIVKQSMLRCNLSIRWCPTQLMLADGLTKDQQDPADLLRSVLRLGEYQLNEEASVLEQKKKCREERTIEVMASSGTPPFDLSQAASIINILRQTGMWDEALRAADRAQSAKLDEKAEGMKMGSMHDGSKRRLFAESQLSPEDEADDFDLISMTGSEATKQAPVVPIMSAGGSQDKAVSLPPGVESIERWGKTICTLPKMAARRCTYSKLVEEAHSNVETREYLAWVKNNSHKSAKAADLKSYMGACGYDPQGSSGVNYPGTNAVREFGD
eukprot:s3134_g4.t2